jgi:CRP/FNR family transcriptional regulator, cyclic AMP receptor protein
MAGGDREAAPAAGHTQKLDYLQENDLFRGLSKADLQQMAERAPMKRVPSGTIVHSPEQPAEVLFILKEGRVRVFRLSPEGRMLTIAVLEAGSIFGEMAALGQRMHDSFAEAMEPCLLCLMSREDVHTLLLADPRIAARLVEILGARLIEAQETLTGMVFRRTHERLALLLLRRAQRPRSLLGGRTPEVRHTHEELADMLGAGRETVTKALNEWAALGYVSLARGRILVLRPEALQLVAEGQPT